MWSGASAAGAICSTSALPHFPDIVIVVCAKAEAAEARTITLIVTVFLTHPPGKADPVIHHADATPGPRVGQDGRRVPPTPLTAIEEPA
jgi:hypothetical protein